LRVARYYSTEGPGIPEAGIPGVEICGIPIGIPSSKMAVLEFPYRGGHRNYRGGLSGDVAMKTVRISLASCSAVLSPNLMALV